MISESDDSSQTNLFLEFWIIYLRLGFEVFVFWARDEFWGPIVTDSLISQKHQTPLNSTSATQI